MQLPGNLLSWTRPMLTVRFLMLRTLLIKLNPLTTARAITAARAFLNITRHLLQLERCSNPVRMRKVFLVLSKKNIFWFGWEVCLGEARKVRVFSVFWPTLTRPGRQSHGPKFWLKLVLETKQLSASIEPLLDLLACLEPKLWLKNPISPQNQKIAENAWVSHWRLL